jgi:hypothetical protein
MRIFYKVLLIILFAMGILFLALSFLPFKTVKSLVNSLCNEGKVNFFNYVFYSMIIYRLRLLSLLTFIIASLIAIYRGSIENYLLIILSKLKISYHDLKNSIIIYINLLIKNHKIELLSFGFIFIIGIFLRIYYLFTPIRIDEAGVFIFLASKSLIVCIFSYPFPGHHVFYTIMVNILHNILGDNVWVMRLPALLTGILLIPATYLLFRAISNNLAALLSSTLVAVSSPLIEYSTNARGYTIVTFIFIISLLLIYYLSENRNLFGWSIFILLSAIGFYTITIFLIPFGILILWYILLVMFNSSKYVYLKDIGLAVIITGLLTFMLYLPIIIVYGSSVVLGNQYVQSLPLLLFIKGLSPMVSSTWASWNQNVQSMIMYLIAFGFIIFLAMIKYANKELRALLISTVLFIIILLSIKRVNPWPRIWLFLIPIYFGLACTGLSYVIEKINRHRLSLSIFFSMVFLTAISSNIILNDSIFNSDTGGQLLVDGEQITKYIKDHVRLKDDKVFVVNLTYRSPMIYYFRKYNLPLNNLLRYNSMENKEFNKEMKKLIVIEVDHALKEKKETVLEDAKVNINDFQSSVLLRKFKASSLYLYQRE